MFVVFPFVDGPTLHAEMLDYHQGMPEERVRPLARQLLGAVQALHAAGIVHRDIKPANLILDDSDGLHLIDFGIAYALGSHDVDKTDDVTLKGAAPGTTFYMSPQQLIHADVTPGFDIFSIGATLFEMLCGTAPESDLLEDEVSARRRDTNWSPPQLAPLQASDDLTSIVMRCLAHDPAQRPSVDDLLTFFADADDDSNETIKIPLEQQAQSAPSSPTMLMRRPPVIAEGAREAGEHTMAKLVRDGVEMPSVQRVHETLAKVDECIVVPNALAHAAIERMSEEYAREQAAEALDEQEPPKEMLPFDPVSTPRRRDDPSEVKGASEAEAAELAALRGREPGDSEQTPERRPHGRTALLVAVAVLLLLAAAGWFALGPNASGTHEPQDEETAPAAIVDSVPAHEAPEPPPPEAEALEPDKPEPTDPALADPEESDKPEPAEPALAEPEESEEPLEVPPTKRRPSKKRRPPTQRKPAPPNARSPDVPPKNTKSPPSSKPKASADQLRTKAKGFLRAGRYDDCIALATETRDAEVLRITSMCKRRKAREDDSP